MKKHLYLFLIVVALFMGYMIGYAVSRSYKIKGKTNKSTTPSDLPASSTKLYKTMQLLDGYYVDPLNTDSIVEEVLEEVVKRLDPHSAYIPVKDIEMVNAELSSSFSGVGIQFTIQDDTVQVVAIIPGGPSERTGLLAGDKIIKVDDSLFVGKKISNERVMHTLRGTKGTEVRLGVKRDGEPELLTFSVIRDDIPIHSVDASFIIERQGKKIGFVSISKFSETTYEEFITALNDLRQKGAKGYIIDLRENAGGLMEPAIQMANEFLQHGDIIVSAQGRNYPRFDAEANSVGRFKSVPVVVMIDNFSASASEIFAGALQDNDRAIIVGRRSFGKGLVQQQIPFEDGSALRLTVARYYTPSGRCIQKPYKIGEQDKYNDDLWERYNRGEFFNKDSIVFADSTVYYTKKGRIVLGGGGIMPDIFVPRDTSKMTPWFTKVVNKAYTYQFALDYTNKHRTHLASFDNYTTLEQYLIGSDCLNRFVDFCQRKGIEPDAKQIETARPLLQRLIFAYIVRNILGDKEFYPLFERDDEMTKKAVEVLLEQIKN